METKTKLGLSAAALIALVTFFGNIFDYKYVLKAEFNESKTDIAVIKEKITSIDKKLDRIEKLLLKE